MKTDGVVGFSTLVHLWQVAGESAYLYRDEANISPETTVKGNDMFEFYIAAREQKETGHLVSSPDKNTAP